MCYHQGDTALKEAKKKTLSYYKMCHPPKGNHTPKSLFFSIKTSLMWKRKGAQLGKKSIKWLLGGVRGNNEKIQ